MITRRIKYGVATLVLSVSSLFVLAPQPALAAAASWDGEGADNNFSTAANWVGDVVPSDGDTLTFDNTSLGADTTVTNDLTNLSLAGVTFSGSGSFNYTVDGNAITLTGAIDIQSASPNLLTDITLGADISITGDSTIIIGDSLNPTSVFDLSGHSLTTSNTYTGFYSVIQGTGNVTNSGFLSLASTNTFTGAINTSGNLAINKAGSLGNSANTATVSGTSARITFCGLKGASVPQNFILNGDDTNGALVTDRGCGGGSPPTTSQPDANVVLGGSITLQKDSKVASQGVTSITGPLSGAFTISLLSGNVGSLVISSSANTSNTPNSTSESQTKVTEVNDKSSAQVQVNPNEILVINEAGERGIIDLLGGTLKGIGKVGTINLMSGKVAPGLSPGVLNTGDLSFSGGTLEIEIGGTTPGTGDGYHDQTNVTGTVALGTGTTLTTLLWNGYSPAVGESYVIINNDGSDAVSGTFSGLAQDASFTQNGVTFSISYTGGDGNDVVLTVTAITATAAAPDTGFAQLVSNPLYALVGTILIAGGVLIARRNLARR